MKSKFLKPILTSLAWAAAMNVLAVHAQQPSPSASPKASSYVRLWNMLPAQSAPAMQLLTAEDKVLLTAPAANYVAGYTSINPGSYTFMVRKANDAANPLKKQPLLMRGDVYVTYLVSEKNGQPVVELIDDTQDPRKINDPAQLVVRQFMPGARVTVAAKDGAASQEVGYGESTILGNLPHQLTFLTIKATGLGPEPKTWNIEADYATYRHATLLVIADPYGRFRPRVAYDGPTVSEMQAALNSTSGSAPR